MCSDTLSGLSRNKFAVYGLLAIAVLTIFNLLLDVPSLQFSNIDQFDHHIAQVREALPRAGTVGYYTDLPENQNGLEEYYLVQYAMAPVVVAKSVDKDFLIANLHTQKPLRLAGFDLVRDFGSGIQLLRKTPK